MSYHVFGWRERGAALASGGPARTVAAADGAAAVFFNRRFLAPAR